MTIKDAKINFIVAEAADLFLSQSIHSVTVKDVAQKAGVGEATLYRLFSTKRNLVCAAAVLLQNDIFTKYFNIEAIQGTGYEKLSLFYHRYLELFTTRRELFRFVNEFDAYMLGGEVEEDQYSMGLDLFKAVCTSAYEEGLKDGSLQPVDDWELFYYASTHAMLELCKKLSAGDIVKQDTLINKEAEIDTLIGIILYRLKNHTG